MNSKLPSVVQAAALLELKNDTAFILVDASAGPTAKDQYIAAHLEGALFVDLEQQLANKKADAANGGRHPLPTVEQFAGVLQQLGISPDSHVVIYDDKNGGNAAARFWWMLKAVGHEKVQVIDGGLQTAVAAGYPTRSGEEMPNQSAAYPIKDWQLPIADMDEVTNAAAANDFIVIDVRDAVRFRGEKEPIDLIAGHIPGAVNIPFTSNLNEQGCFLTPVELKDKYEQALEQYDIANTIVHCGSGVTACHTLLAMDYAGLEIPKLYVGSWSEWSRNDKPIGKGA